MKNWIRLDIDTTDALSIDVKEHCFDNTDRADVFIEGHSVFGPLAKMKYSNRVG